ncbi:MAG: Wzz/FepE/Etk N-terminal domain-containing protein [Candidatus Margulisiibacteriota bacterium]
MTKNNNDFTDDEIDLLPYIKHLLQNWRYFLLIIPIALAISFLFFLILPKKYKASTTFLMPESTSVGIGTGLLASLGYSSGGSLNGGQSGIYGTYLMPIFNSNRIKVYVANLLINNAYFSDNPDFMRLSKQDQINYILGTLDLSDNLILEQKEGVHVIEFVHESPKIILPVLNAYLNALIKLNDELNIDSDVLQIIPLDVAIEPKSYFSPNIKIFFVVNGMVLFFILFSLLIIQKYIYLNFKDKK